MAEKAAEEIFKDFKSHSVAEFFKKNKQMLGLYGKIRSLTTIVHETTTNSLDACEEAKILPKIDVKLVEIGEEYYELTSTDNGPGIPKDTIGKALGQLLAGTKFHRLVQTRGQQGIGVSGVILFSQLTTGKPVRIISGTKKGKPISMEITIDTKKNEAKIANEKELSTQFQGLAIKAQFKDILFRKSEQSPEEYLRRTAIANPHAEISFLNPFGEKITFRRTSKEIPEAPIEVQPHPKGITVDEINTMSKYTMAKKTSSFLKQDFDRIGDKAIKELNKLVDFDLNKDPKKLSWSDCEQIVKGFKRISFIAPRLDALRPIGMERIDKSLKSIVKPEFVSVVTRKPSVYSGGFPFQVEVAIAYGGDAGRTSSSGSDTINGEESSGRRGEIMRFANRAPLMFDGGACAITKAINSVEWKRYGVKNFDNAPLTVFVNLLSVHIPYTSAGKTAISDDEEILEELRLALMDAGRKISGFINLKKKIADKTEKKKIFLKYIPEIAESLSKITSEKQKDLEKKLTAMVMEKLRLEEMQEKAESKKAKGDEQALIEETSDQEEESDEDDD
ncbi:MAG: DNA topoisomerase VI subunit B [archaeon]